MQLNPRYGDDPIIVLDGPPAAIAEPTTRQRRRLAATLATLTEDQWAQPSRCEGWTVRDVIVHLDSTNTFWAHTIATGRQGERTEILATFDPVASPAEMVAAAPQLSGDEALDRFVASTDALQTVLESLGADDWTAIAEAPPGHISISAVTHHALWDAWIHERDVLLPLGLAPDREPDEIAAALRYVAAVGPAINKNLGEERHGVVTIEATDPDLTVVVDIGDRVTVRTGPGEDGLSLAGDAVHLLEALSRRVPLGQQIPDGAIWMVGGLAEIFDEDGG